MAKRDSNIERIIADYCAHLGITREQYDAEPALEDFKIPALVRLRELMDSARPGEEWSVIVPEGLPGEGKCWGELSEDESCFLTMLESELQDLENEDFHG